MDAANVTSVSLAPCTMSSTASRTSSRVRFASTTASVPGGRLSSMRMKACMIRIGKSGYSESRLSHGLAGSPGVNAFLTSTRSRRVVSSTERISTRLGGCRSVGHRNATSGSTSTASTPPSVLRHLQMYGDVSDGRGASMRICIHDRQRGKRASEKTIAHKEFCCTLTLRCRRM